MVEYKIIFEILLILLLAFSFYKAGYQEGFKSGCDGELKLNNSVYVCYKEELVNNSLGYAYVNFGGETYGFN